VIDSAGTLSASTAYDAWGEPATSGGLSSQTPFGFAGGYTDGTGLTYFLYRYYDAYTGQFFTVDPISDRTGSPYLYASDDPINDVDPSGLCGQRRSNNPFPPLGGGRSVGVFSVEAISSETSILAKAFASASGKTPPYVGTLRFTLENVDGLEVRQSWPFAIPISGATPEFLFDGLEPGFYKVVGTMTQGRETWEGEDWAEVPAPRAQTKPSTTPKKKTTPSIFCGPGGCRIGVWFP
jgi:RHS repeat-associated protein